MNSTGSERMGPMLNPPHLGELIRESMDEVGWNVTETAARLGCERAPIASAERQGGRVREHGARVGNHRLGYGDHWVRMQASYKLAQARRARGWQEDMSVRDAVPR